MLAGPGARLRGGLGRVLTGILTALAVCAAPAGAAIPSGNLLVNPGAEDGAGATGTETVAPPGWMTTEGFTAFQYGASSGPTTADSAAYDGGANYFAGGNAVDASVAWQTVDVSAAAPEIDTGSVEATIAALLGGWQGQEDNMTITAVYLDENGSGLGGVGAGPVTAEERDYTTGLLPRSETAAVTPGTRSIFVLLVASRSEGVYNDGYGDNASLTLSEAPPPPERGETVTAGVVSGTILVREKGTGQFRELQANESIPVGSSVDATEGRVKITSATKGGGTQTTDFYEGLFKFTQGATGLVTASLEGAAFNTCRARDGARASKKLARLWGNGGGRARTKGRRGSGTVRGTVWLIEERCNGTYFSVEEGALSVRDFTRKRTETLRAGEDYLARNP